MLDYVSVLAKALGNFSLSACRKVRGAVLHGTNQEQAA